MKQDIPVVFCICMSAGIELDLLPIVLLLSSSVFSHGKLLPDYASSYLYCSVARAFKWIFFSIS